MFREVLMPILLNSFKKLQRKEHFQTHSMRPPSPIPKPDRDNTKKSTYRPISLMNIDAKILNKNFSKQNSATHQKAHTP